MQKKAKLIAILVLNYNGKQYLSACYKSLLKQTNHNFDIWLIDNNSSDDSISYTKKNFRSVKIFNTKDNLGYSGSYNKAHQYFKAKNISYTYYLFLNNDTKADRFMVDSLLKGMSLEANTGAISPAILDENNILAMDAGKFLFVTGTTLGSNSGGKYTRNNTYLKSFWVSGCCFMTPVSIFNQLDGFANYFIYYEDLDYSWRLQNLGYKVIFLENTFVNHLQGGAKTATKFQIYLNERNRITSYYRNLPLLVFFFYLPILLIFRLILIANYASTTSLKLTKIKAMIQAIFELRHHKRYSANLLNQLKVILSMNTVKKVSIL